MEKPAQPLICLGIDPGSHSCGYAVVASCDCKQLDLLAYGKIVNHNKDVVKRIRAIEHGLRTMWDETGLDNTALLAYECPYSGTGAGSAGKSGLQQVWMTIGMLLTLPALQVQPMHVATVQAAWGRKRGIDRKTGKIQAMRAAETFFGIQLGEDDSDAADAMWVAISAIRKASEGK